MNQSEGSRPDHCLDVIAYGLRQNRLRHKPVVVMVMHDSLIHKKVVVTAILRQVKAPVGTAKSLFDRVDMGIEG